MQVVNQGWYPSEVFEVDYEQQNIVAMQHRPLRNVFLLHKLNIMYVGGVNVIEHTCVARTCCCVPASRSSRATTRLTPQAMPV